MNDTNRELESKQLESFARFHGLKHTLPGVTSYFILNGQGDHQRVMVPFGKIADSGKIEIPPEWQAQIGYHVYDVHRRFGNLIAKGRLGRLHLAGLYASSSSYLPDKRTGKSGFNTATYLTRQCWTNEPLSSAEREKLAEVSSHSKLCCTLRLMCSWIWKSSNSLRFLHTDEKTPLIADLLLDPIAVDEYRQNKFSSRLSPSEEQMLLGTTQATVITHPFHATRESDHLSFVTNWERELRKRYVLDVLYLQETQAGKVERPFPLRRPTHLIGLEAKVHDDLVDSWEYHCSLPEKDPRVATETWVVVLILTRARQVKVLTSLLQEISAGDGSVAGRLA